MRGKRKFTFDENDSFRQLGLNSVIYVRVARRVGTVLGVPIKPDVIFRNRTCAALADYLLTLDDGGGASPAAAVPAPAPAPEPEPAPWRDYRDKRVLALLQNCADGGQSLDRTIELIRAGMPGAVARQR